MKELNPLLRFFYVRGHRLKQAAEHTGIPLGTLGPVCQGYRKMSSDLRAKIAEAYGVSVRSVPVPKAAGVGKGRGKGRAA